MRRYTLTARRQKYRIIHKNIKQHRYKLWQLQHDATLDMRKIDYSMDQLDELHRKLAKLTDYSELFTYINKETP